MKQNHRAVTKTPLADDYYGEDWLRVTIGPVTGHIVEHASGRMRQRMRNRVGLPNRSIPAGNDKPPRNFEWRLNVRHDLAGKVVTNEPSKAREYGVFGGLLVGGDASASPIERVFPEWSGEPDKPPSRRRKRKAAKHKPPSISADERERMERETRERKRKAERRYKRRLMRRFPDRGLRIAMSLDEMRRKLWSA